MLPNSDEVDCFGPLISVVDYKLKNAGFPPRWVGGGMCMWSCPPMALANRG